MGKNTPTGIQTRFALAILLASGMWVGFVSAFAKTQNIDPALEVQELLLDKHYAAATPLLETLLVAAPSAANYYNLAFTYHRAGRTADASWAAASSAVLGGVEPLPALTAAIRSDLPAQLRPLEVWGPVKFWRKLSTLLPAPGYLYAGLALWWCGFAVLAASTLGLQKLSGWRGWASAACLLGACCLALGYTAHQLLDSPVAVVMERTPLQASPSASAPKIQALPAGVELILGEHLSGYYATTLPTGASGWVDEEAVKRVLSKE